MDLCMLCRPTCISVGVLYMFRDRRVDILKKKALFRKAVPQKKQKAPNIINNKLGTSFVKNPCM